MDDGLGNYRRRAGKKLDTRGPVDWRTAHCHGGQRFEDARQARCHSEPRGRLPWHIGAGRRTPETPAPDGGSRRDPAYSSRCCRRKRAVPVERLCNDKIGRYIISRWEETVAKLDEQQSMPPKLKNTDGDELLLTVDRFEFEPSARNELEERLAVFEDVEREDSDGSGHQTFDFTRPGNPMHRSWENTVIGRATVSNGRVRLETNSIERADALRDRIEIACGDLIRHRAREHSDPIAAHQKNDMEPRGSEKPLENMSTEESKLLREVKERHYSDWANQPVPTLGDKTPREAVRTKTGRDQVDLLLKVFENHEARLPKSQQVDFFSLRKELGFKT